MKPQHSLVPILFYVIQHQHNNNSTGKYNNRAQQLKCVTL